MPNAAHAESADFAKSATDAQTALNAVNAITAQSVNGHEAGCLPGTQAFAGACWQGSSSETAVSAPAAANSCAVQGGALPEALQLAAFSQQPGVVLDSGEEWSSDTHELYGARSVQRCDCVGSRELSPQPVQPKPTNSAA